jgi:hypothetical protein
MNELRASIVFKHLLVGLSLSIVTGLGLLQGCRQFPVCSPVQAANTRQAKVLSGGTLQSQGKAFLPFGVYHVSWNVSPSKVVQHLQEIAGIGLNTVHASITDASTYPSVLQKADQSGITVLSEHRLDWQTVLGRFRNQPAVMGWNLADDVDNGQRSPQDILNLHRRVKTLDPNRLTYISGYSDQLQRFQGCSDIIALQVYPLQQGTPDEFAEVYPRLVALRRAIPIKNRQAVFANLQAFSWKIAKPGYYTNSRAPNALELRNMTYQAFLAAVNGILYYTYYDETWHLSQNKSLWPMMKTLAQETKTLTPYLTSRQPRTLSLATPLVKAGLWRSQQTGLLIALSLTSQRPQRVTVPLGAKIQSLTPLFGTPLPQATASSLALQLNPLDVQVFQINF